MGKKVFILLGIFLILISVSCSSKIEEIDETSYQEILKQVEFEDVVVRKQKVVWEEMHKMANTKITANEIWGKIEITEDRVSTLLTEVIASDYDDKKQLLTILYNWKHEDFSETVEEHNYLWRRLDGTVGKAYGLRKN